jgi:Family of unknown function (DUF5995)
VAQPAPTDLVAPSAVSGSLADVIEQMHAILAPLARGDGVACFTRLYLAVTEDVQARLAAANFVDPAFLADLDHRFADLFFAACRPADGARPAAWAPLFDARDRTGIAPIQFALAGMNAHINRDLPVALVAACQHAQVTPSDGSPQHRDYLQVNQLLAGVETKLKARYMEGWLHAVDRLIHRVHRLDDAVAMWDIRRARDAAWTNAQALWELRSEPGLAARYLDALDGTVGLAGRGLLIPADTLLSRLRRPNREDGPASRGR